MKYNTIIIGGGLAGLISGIELQKKGQRCLIISSGQSALHFASGSFDLLNRLPDQTPVNQPLNTLNALREQAPEHPYAKLSDTQFQQLAQRAKALLIESGLQVNGSEAQNHLRISPMGHLCPSWLSLADATYFTDPTELQNRAVTVVNIEGFLDFQPQFVADQLNSLGAKCNVVTIQLPELDRLRENPSEFRSSGLANVLEHPENYQAFVQTLREHCPAESLILLPACIGSQTHQLTKTLSQTLNQPVMLIPTMPPSLLGMRTYQLLKQYYHTLGGHFMLGDTVLKAEIKQQRVDKIFTHNHGDIPLYADNFILASGSFFSRGLESTFEKVYEPIFDLSIEYPADREHWSDINFFNPQAYMQFGVKTDHQFRAIKAEQSLQNLFVAGAILGGFDALQTGCGAGVSIISALAVSDYISA